MASTPVDDRSSSDHSVPPTRADAERSADPRLETSARARRGPGWSSLPFLALHVAPAFIILTGVSLRSLALLAGTFWARMFCITAGYHRYFAHRSYRMRRGPQFVMALAGTSALQKGPLWWASHHREHHRLADRPGDLHSPLDGFWSSHLLWFMREENARTRTERIPDLVSYPELRFLDRHDMIGPVLLAGACYLVDGWRGVVVGFLASTVLLRHATFTINSLAHVLGRRRYATSDGSRNSFLLAVLTMGEGWHNNHHYRPSSCRNGFYWWEWDPTYYVIRIFDAIGVVSDVRSVTKPVRACQRVDAGAFDVGMFSYRISQASRTLGTAGVAADQPPSDAALEVTRDAGPSRLEHLLGDLRAAAADVGRVQRRADRGLGAPVAVHLDGTSIPNRRQEPPAAGRGDR